MASIRQIREAYRMAARDAVRDIATVVEDKGAEVIEAEAIDRGDLLASSRFKMDKDRPRGVVRWGASHAVYVNYGSRPHWPPFQPIFEWVKRNLQRYTGTAGKSVDAIRPTGKAAERARRSPDSAAIKVARAIQASIAKEGTAPVPYANRAAAEGVRKAPAILAASIDARLGALK